MGTYAEINTHGGIDMGNGRLAALFGKAEQSGVCVAQAQKRDYDLIRSRYVTGEVVSPRSGLYARRSYWEALSPSEQALHVMRTLAAQRPRYVFSGLSAAVAYGLYVSYEDQSALYAISSYEKAAPQSDPPQKMLPARATAARGRDEFSSRPRPSTVRRCYPSVPYEPYGYRDPYGAMPYVPLQDDPWYYEPPYYDDGFCNEEPPEPQDEVLCEVYPSRSYRLSSRKAARSQLRDGALPTRTVRGVTVTDLCQTVLDAMRLSLEPEALAIADSAARFYGLTQERLARFVEEHGKGTSGVSAARWAVARMSARSECGAESAARAVMELHGFMVPRLQVMLPTRFAREPYARVDFCWELSGGAMVIGELEDEQIPFETDRYGQRFIVAPQVLRARNERAEHLAAQGAAVMRFTYRDVCDTTYFTSLLESYGIPRRHTYLRI